MNSDQLRALQTPWKEKYRANPDSAQVTLNAQGTVDVAQLACEIEHSGPALTHCGLHPLTGGDGTAACAAEMLLKALIGCAGVTFAAVCTSMGIPITTARLVAAGEIDFRGTLGVSREAPVGFQSIHLTFEIASDAPEETLAKAVELAERYCVVAQSIKHLTADWRRIPS